jgi:hypothetical protein
VAALVVEDGTVTLVVTAVPYVARLAAAEPIAVSGAAAASLSGLAVRDLNGDGRPDFAVFSAREDLPDGSVPQRQFAQMFALYQVEDEPRLATMSRAEVELLGVRDAATLDAALSSLGRYEPPAEAMSPARFIARLRYATPAQLRAAVAPSGLRLCTDYPDRSGRRRLRCNTVPAARVENAAVAARVRAALGTFAEVQTTDADALQPPWCERRGAETRCESNIGGPAGVHWSLIGEGASMRLIEVAPWGESE